jgi:hypothetical protein
VHAAELKPERRRPRCHGVLDHVGQTLAPPEHVDEVDAARDVLDSAVNVLAQDLVFPRVDRNHLVAALQQIAGDSMAVAMGLGGKADDRDAPSFGKKPRERGIVGVTVWLVRPGFRPRLGHLLRW